MTRPIHECTMRVLRAALRCLWNELSDPGLRDRDRANLTHAIEAIDHALADLDPQP